MQYGVMQEFRVFSLEHQMYWEQEDLVMDMRGRLLDRDGMAIPEDTYIWEPLIGYEQNEAGERIAKIFVGDIIAVPFSNIRRDSVSKRAPSFTHGYAELCAKDGYQYGADPLPSYVSLRTLQWKEKPYKYPCPSEYWWLAGNINLGTFKFRDIVVPDKCTDYFKEFLTRTAAAEGCLRCKGTGRIWSKVREMHQLSTLCPNCQSPGAGNPTINAEGI